MNEIFIKRMITIIGLFTILYFGYIYFGLPQVEKESFVFVGDLVQILAAVLAGSLALLAFMPILVKDWLLSLRRAIENYIDLEKKGHKFSFVANMHGIENIYNDFEKIKYYFLGGCSDSEIYFLKETYKKIRRVKQTLRNFLFFNILNIFVIYLLFLSSSPNFYYITAIILLSFLTLLEAIFIIMQFFWGEQKSIRNLREELEIIKKDKECYEKIDKALEKLRK